MGVRVSSRVRENPIQDRSILLQLPPQRKGLRERDIQSWTMQDMQERLPLKMIIIVPAARAVRHLEFSSGLARDLGIPLLVLASGDCDPQLAALTADMVVECGVPPEGNLPLLPGQVRRDLAAKRNLGLEIARSLGFRYALFLDDDISGVTPEGVSWAKRKLDSGHDAAGFHVTDFPDNSVVMHAARATGDHVPVHVSGGAVMMSTLRDWGECPDVYGEDWFLLQGSRMAFPGPAVRQAPYDPFSPGRAASEEAGDFLSERMRMPGAGILSESWWGDQLILRREFLAGIAARTREPRILSSLAGAREVNSEITPQILTGWVEAWLRTGKSSIPST